ncbi:helix-turn-helix transcriptional regulator [Acinetobacter sp. YH16038]|uniref:helix-turn-helix transcriptional regulator n=1 Tax=Acinetobacter sp. YH16038 TaxID=2601183 RepID=UPI00211DE4F2|nr:helix-turn-helix domain-containing protein [Acinetobacter sp. YH16038]
MLKNDIIVFRAKKRWTQQQLADAVAVSRQTIAALEKEKYNPLLSHNFSQEEAQMNFLLFYGYFIG